MRFRELRKRIFFCSKFWLRYSFEWICSYISEPQFAIQTYYNAIHIMNTVVGIIKYFMNCILILHLYSHQAKSLLELIILDIGRGQVKKRAEVNLEHFCSFFKSIKNSRSRVKMK